MIAIIDYGLGNVQAFANIYKRLNIRAEIVGAAEDLRRANRLILPGVGAFDWGMMRLKESGLRESLEEMVIDCGKPILGVCVGMQMMADRSDEGVLPGLGWIRGEVRRFDASRAPGRLPLPHMGWNDVEPRAGDTLFKGLPSKARFYFLHSYYFVPSDDDRVLAETAYDGQFASGVFSRNIFGVQFHPEKSHHWGIQLLKNFAEL